mgnify:FL=1
MKQRNYFYSILAIVSFFSVIMVTFFVHNGTILDYYAGDVLVVIMLYAVLRILTTYDKKFILFSVVWFLCILEFLQIFHGKLLDSVVITKLFGSVFDLRDLVAYGLGGVLVWIIERGYDRYFVVNK